jgi:D-alanyl-D-alanine dipeptidase
MCRWHEHSEALRGIALTDQRESMRPHSRQVRQSRSEADREDVAFMRLIVLRVAALSALCAVAHGQRPADIIDARQMIPDLIVEMRYAGRHNFIGRPIPGYRAAKCLLTRSAATALRNVQSQLREFGFALKVYDCYRPQSAVDYFVAWGRDLEDQEMKAEFYPSVDKRDLFRDGYIAEKSGHSRGSTMDLTVVAVSHVPAQTYDPAAPLLSCENDKNARFADSSIDMGTGYDCFSTLSHTSNPDIGVQQRANRLLLKTLMESSGFTNLEEEWWHFTLSGEPYPDSYFDFPVE